MMLRIVAAVAVLVALPSEAAAKKEVAKGSVIFNNLDHEEMTAILRLAREETGHGWTAHSGSWGGARLALFEEADLDRFDADPEGSMVRLTAAWTADKRSLAPLIFTSWANPIGEELLLGHADAAQTAEIAAIMDRTRDAFVDHFGLRAPVDGGDEAAHAAPWAPPALAYLAGKTAETGGEILVLDDVVDDDLRARLLGLLHAPGHDPASSPDPNFWFTESDGRFTLKPESLVTLCAQPPEGPTPPPIADLQRRIMALVAGANPSGGILARVPYSASGNASRPIVPCGFFVSTGTAADSRVAKDLDPRTLKPSAWTDAFGNYANRSPGRPRFVTALVALDDSTDQAYAGMETAFRVAWGGRSTKKKKRKPRIQDVPRSPGRLVLYDSDVARGVRKTIRTVTPRYTLALNLVLHPFPDPDDDAGGVDASRILALIDERRWGAPATLDGAGPSWDDLRKQVKDAKARSGEGAFRAAVDAKLGGDL